MKSLSSRPHISQPADGASRLAAPDLQSQLEALLDTVWESEANWRLDDRIDLATQTPRRHR